MMRYYLIALIVCFSFHTVFAEDIIRAPRGLTVKEALEVMFSSNPSIDIYKKEVEISKARYQQAGGEFDPVLSTFITEQRDWPNRNKSQLTYNKITSGIQVSKKTRLGIELNGGIRASCVEQNGENTENPNAFFNLSIPLLRSLKKNLKASEEISYKIDYQAAKLDMQDSISMDIMNMLIAYWYYVAAYERLQITIQTEKRAQTLVNEVEELIKSDERPVADINLTLANLANTSASRASEEQNFFEKMHTLFRLMGYKEEELGQYYSIPGSSLPEVLDNRWDDEAIGKQFIKKAMESRKIYKAYQEKEGSTKIRMLAAQNEMRPSVNLNLGLKVSKSQEGFEPTEKYGPFYEGTITLTYEWPVGNNKASGNYASLAADYNKTLLEIARLENTIKSMVKTKLSRIARIIEKYKEREKSVKLYDKTLENEQKKFRLGMSTTIDIISTEQLYLEALLDRITDRLEYAITLTELGYEIGDIAIDMVTNTDLNIDINKFFNPVS